MSAFLAELSSQLKGIWARLDGGQRMIVASVMFATAAGLGAILWYSSRPDYVEIKQFADGQAMRDAQTALVSAGIPVVTEGDVIKVDRDRFAEAGTVLFQGGFEGSASPSIADTLGGFIPDRETRLQIMDEQKRGLAEAAVRSIDDIADVTVTASNPKLGPFRAEDDRNMPSATASIRLQSGADFFQVAPHVASVVASAVGISKQFVEVRDIRTHRSWQFDPDSANGTSMNDFLVMQKDLSDSYTRLAQSALDAVFPGKTQVIVHVELDNNWERRREVLRPAEPVVTSDKTTKETSENGTRSSGDPGIASGLSDDSRAPVPSGTNSTTRNESRDRTYDTKDGEREVAKLAPDTVRITCAVLIDEADEALAGRVEDIREVVMNIIGSGTSEDITVKAFPFPEPEPFDLPAGPGVMDLVREWAPGAGQVLGVVLVLLFLRGLLKRALPAPVKSGTKGRPGREVEEDVSPEEAARRIRGEIEKTISEDPAAISRLLESWLSEQKA